MTCRRLALFVRMTPPPLPIEAEAAIVALVARTYPNCGNQLEAAARLAARLGWATARATTESARP